MGYVYELRFDVRPDQIKKLEMGGPLERVLSFLRARLPNEPGYITSRGMVSIDIPDRRIVVFQSVWEEWGDLDVHRQSGLLEDKAMEEFGHLKDEDLRIHIYEEVGPT
jgi:quinol monooxygenase YgiN